MPEDLTRLLLSFAVPSFEYDKAVAASSTNAADSTPEATNIV